MQNLSQNITRCNNYCIWFFCFHHFTVSRILKEFWTFNSRMEKWGWNWRMKSKNSTSLTKWTEHRTKRQAATTPTNTTISNKTYNILITGTLKVYEKNLFNLNSPVAIARAPLRELSNITSIYSYLNKINRSITNIKVKYWTWQTNPRCSVILLGWISWMIAMLQFHLANRTV